MCVCVCVRERERERERESVKTVITVIMYSSNLVGLEPCTVTLNRLCVVWVEDLFVMRGAGLCVQGFVFVAPN